MLIAVIGFGRNAVLTRPDNVLTTIMYTSATRVAGAHIIMTVYTRKQKRFSLLPSHHVAGERCNKMQLSTIDLFTVNARLSLLGSLEYIARVQSLYIPNLCSSF